MTIEVLMLLYQPYNSTFQPYVASFHVQQHYQQHLQTCKHSHFMVVPTSHKILAATVIATTSFFLYHVSLFIPEVFHSSGFLNLQVLFTVTTVHDYF
jgi:hypothetical protein